MKRRIILWLLRMLGYDAKYLTKPELFVVLCGDRAFYAGHDREVAFARYRMGASNWATELVRYVPAERILGS